ncbi:MAG TPA: mechanosensitive ion channel family protein [Ramlibacter sp.]|nr:mechanosensitive ion channel family protein [Ramlibacter sp.]
MDFDWNDFAALGRPALVAMAAATAALIAHLIGRAVTFKVVRNMVVVKSLVHSCDRPAGFVLPLIAMQAVWHATPDSVESIGGLRHFNGVLVIIALTWLAIGAVRGIADGVLKLYPADVADNLNARRIHTQTRVLSRTACGALLIAGVAFSLMTFPGARQFGASLLASAGVVGLVAGIAARSVFSNLIAGLQIALAQPIRLDDVLIVEGEWGRVEEITGTYVVLRIWDERRLIIPLQWFIEHPFQNWTRTTSEIIGTVFLWVDYTMPLEPLRQAARLACEASPHWDGRLCLLQVTEAGERNMQLRVLVTSASSSQNWDLRCAVREALVEFMQREYPQALPGLRARVDVDQAWPGASPPPATHPPGTLNRPS